MAMWKEHHRLTKICKKIKVPLKLPIQTKRLIITFNKRRVKSRVQVRQRMRMPWTMKMKMSMKVIQSTQR